MSDPTEKLGEALKLLAQASVISQQILEAATEQSKDIAIAYTDALSTKFSGTVTNANTVVAAAMLLSAEIDRCAERTSVPRKVMLEALILILRHMAQADISVPPGATIN